MGLAVSAEGAVKAGKAADPEKRVKVPANPEKRRADQAAAQGADLPAVAPPAPKAAPSSSQDTISTKKNHLKSKCTRNLPRFMKD